MILVVKARLIHETLTTVNERGWIYSEAACLNNYYRVNLDVLKLVKLIVFLLFYFTRAAADVKRVEMMDKLNHTATSGVDQPADFSMQILTSHTQSEIEMVSVSYGLDRSISNAVERNMKASEVDLCQVMWMRTEPEKERKKNDFTDFYGINLIYDTRHFIHSLPWRKRFVFSFFFKSYSLLFWAK